VARLRDQLAKEPGANLYLQSAQDLRVGGRGGNAQYQFTLQGDDLDELRTWEPRIRLALSKLPQLADVNTDQQDRSPQITLDIDRAAAAQLGVSMKMLSSTLNDLFGQRQVSTIYKPLNQYRVVLEARPEYTQGPASLDSVYISTASGAQVPLSSVARWAPTQAPLAVNHQGQFAASTISFNLNAGASLSQAQSAITEAMRQLNPPRSVQGGFQGTAKAFQASTSNQPLLVLAALLTIYIVLGVLYESLVHPITILSTLPSAGLGALLALMAVGTEFSLIAFIGVILLIGIVKKNAILMIDFALDAQRTLGLDAKEAIHRAAVLRLRPILMTTLAAMLGALPLALGTGEGSETRQPLGIAIVGGLLVSQILTLYTTPVVYLGMERLRNAVMRRFKAAPSGPVIPVPT
jgi:multidrug efflux pump